MAKAVFTTKITPSYNDLPELMYHFPKTYLRQATAAIGDWIVYYEPRRESSSPDGRSGRQSYFATARVVDVKEDSATNDHFYAFVDNYIEFSSPVPFKIGTSYFESGLKKSDGSTNKGAFGRAVRNIPDDEYQAIISSGLEKIEADISEPLEESEIVFDIQRPLIQQIIERPFREIAFSRLVKEEYGFACAVTGIGIKDNLGKVEVEAAHIKPVKLNGPDSVRNGIALCRTIHWMFDRGLVSLADSGDIIVKQIVPNQVIQLFNNDGKIRKPSNLTYAPHPEFLKFHREQIYKV